MNDNVFWAAFKDELEKISKALPPKGAKPAIRARDMKKAFGKVTEPKGALGPAAKTSGKPSPRSIAMGGKPGGLGAKVTSGLEGVKGWWKGLSPAAKWGVGGAGAAAGLLALKGLRGGKKDE